MSKLVHAPISISSLGSHVVVAGVSGKRIQVYGLFFQCGITTNLTIKADTTNLTGSMSFLTGGGLVLNPFSDVYFDLPDGVDLVFSLSGLTGQVGGMITYMQVDV